jgi:hypothetical protein
MTCVETVYIVTIRSLNITDFYIRFQRVQGFRMLFSCFPSGLVTVKEQDYFQQLFQITDGFSVFICQAIGAIQRKDSVLFGNFFYL